MDRDLKWSLIEEHYIIYFNGIFQKCEMEKKENATHGKTKIETLFLGSCQ